MRLRRLLPLGLAAALAIVPATAQAARKPRLITFDSCRSLVGYAHTYAARAGGVGVPVRAVGAPPEVLQRPTALMDDSASSGGSGPTAAPQPSAPASAEKEAAPFSGTNVQEAG